MLISYCQWIRDEGLGQAPGAAYRVVILLDVADPCTFSSSPSLTINETDLLSQVAGLPLASPAALGGF